jgi:hypothetical protein
LLEHTESQHLTYLALDPISDAICGPHVEKFEGTRFTESVFHTIPPPHCEKLTSFYNLNSTAVRVNLEECVIR